MLSGLKQFWPSSWSPLNVLATHIKIFLICKNKSKYIWPWHFTIINCYRYVKLSKLHDLLIEEDSSLTFKDIFEWKFKRQLPTCNILVKLILWFINIGKIYSSSKIILHMEKQIFTMSWNGKVVLTKEYIKKLQRNGIFLQK